MLLCEIKISQQENDVITPNDRQMFGLLKKKQHLVFLISFSFLFFLNIFASTFFFLLPMSPKISRSCPPTEQSLQTYQKKTEVHYFRLLAHRLPLERSSFRDRDIQRGSWDLWRAMAQHGPTSCLQLGVECSGGNHTRQHNGISLFQGSLQAVV